MTQIRYLIGLASEQLRVMGHSRNKGPEDEADRYIGALHTHPRRLPPMKRPPFKQSMSMYHGKRRTFRTAR